MIKFNHLKFVIWILILSFTTSLGISGSLSVDPDSDCFYTPFDSARAGEFYPALLYLSCTGAVPSDLDSIRYMADSLGLVLASCHASRNHRDIETNDRGIMRTYEKLVRDYPVDPRRIFIYGFSGQAVQAQAELFLHPDFFRGVVSVCGHAAALPLIKPGTLEGKIIYLISKEKDWNLKANREMHDFFNTNGVQAELFIAPGEHAPASSGDFHRGINWLLDNSR
jgi:predicted esterase